MKTKSVNKKLTLKKMTVAQLEDFAMKAIQGGASRPACKTWGIECYSKYSCWVGCILTL